MPTVAPWPDWADSLPPAAAGVERPEGGTRLATGGAAPRRADPESPTVSYVTVVRNARETLGRTLASVRSQTWPAVEHIVIDGDSSDGTRELIKAHESQIAYWASEPDGGLYDALNKAIPLARGRLICVLNADDWLTPDAAEVAVRAHRAAGSADAALVLTAAWKVRASGQRLWLPGSLDRAAWLRCAHVCHNAVYATPAAYEATGPYAATMRIAADFRWLMAAVDANLAWSAVDEPTVHFAPGGLSSDVGRHTRECAQVIADRFDGLDDDEVWALMHAFHRFRGNLDRFASSRPAQLGRAIDRLCERHADQGDLMAAIAQAAAQVMQHPDDRRAGGDLTLPEKARRGLRKLRMALRERRRRAAG